MKTRYLILGGCLLGTLSARAVTVENVLVRQQWPWSSKVHIDYVLRDAEGDVHDVQVVFKNGTEALNVPTESLTGDRLDVGPGEHRIVWDPTYAGLFSDKKVLTDVTATVSVADDDRKYMIVDMSEGASADKFPVSFAARPPSGGWNQYDYKTTKLVFRRIPATVFQMGMTAAETNHFPLSEFSPAVLHGRRTVVLTKPYYIAIFETTWLQRALVLGGSFTEYQFACKPCRGMSYADVRGVGSNLESHYWPHYAPGSLVDLLNKKVAAALETALPGYRIDLPSFAQWECACRAGTSTCFNNGKNWSEDGSALIDANLDDICWYAGNSGGEWKDVGGKDPNAFGLYDMLGNAFELVRDCMRGATPPVLDSPQTDPLNFNGGAENIWSCGGGVLSPASECLSDSILFSGLCDAVHNPPDSRYYNGFRLACVYEGE